jgi:hypothetical protein
MTIRISMLKTMRRALACGASAIALALVPAAWGQGANHAKAETDVYFLRSNHEYSDSHATMSTSRDIVVGRTRLGDRSMILQDFQGGAMTVESGGRTKVYDLSRPVRFDAAATYDYSKVQASGASKDVAVFNTYLKPLIAQFPAPRADGSWSAHSSLAALGLPAQGAEGDVLINLLRTTFAHQGEDLVLIEFDVPAFTYRLPGGETVTHWARGMAVTDRDFAVIRIAASQHRATAITADGTVRPFAVRTSLHGIEADGNMSLRLEETPQVAAAVRRLAETRGDQIMALNDGLAAEAFPNEVAGRLDLAAFAIGEGGGNPLPTTTGPTRLDPLNLPPDTQDKLATFRADASAVLVQKGMSQQDADSLLTALLQPDRSRSLDERSLEVRSYLSPLFSISADAKYRYNNGTPEPTDALIRQVIDIYIRQDNSLTIEYRLTDARRREIERRAKEGLPLDDPELAKWLEDKEALHKDILDMRYERMLQYLRVIETPPVNFDELVPGLLDDPANATDNEAMFALLQEQMERELKEAEEIIARLREEAKREEETVYEDTDDFFKNNAFDYTSMVGVVPTDLSRWGEWLATQNVRELERLALTIGYPNLASALADAENIIRQSQDPGYRQWALQAPSCSGLAGCGPSYLERWHAKQSVVALGDILADSRDIFSTGGFSDIGISGLDLSYLLRDHALEDGDIVRIRISQFGKVIYEGTVNLTNAGQVFGMLLGRGVASLEIFAVNEGSASPNTAQITVDKVVRGQATQTYSLNTGQTATLRIEAGAKPAPAAGTSGAPQ